MEWVLAELKYKPMTFEVVKNGNYVICFVSGKHIPLDQLLYWNVEKQEAYYGPKEAQERYEELNKCAE
ncbi:uncharacterized protein METZ01_LOCUS237715 [marine metagenome]|uniref:DUF2093 domain-containing protein n=1 Tax=marine metagenome TaxID=408172 RepID=A0A382HEF2_9ZZZZ